ncbi:MAG: zinc ABC transporter substrate-binding protein [Bacilli bacterium]|nr:zinc ABC transporter substrate-binding protein [Bacilli bacterium]
MKKKICLFIMLSLVILTVTGCSLFKRDNMENISIITTNYSLEYAVKSLYGENALITSIYPDGVNIDNYSFTEKQIKDYSAKDMFIYMGLTKDSNQAVTFLNKNNKIKIIDATFGMQFKNKEDELWLNPSNLLMISQNIKNGLSEYISSTYLLKNIDKLYEQLKVELSSLDAEYKTSIENANFKTIFVNDDALLYLTKYDLEVISLDKENLSYDKNIQLFKSYLKQGTIKYLYVYENSVTQEDVDAIVNENNVEKITFKNLKNITDEERESEQTYVSLMYDNLENLKKELYKNG